jgi:ATP-binding cassette subfamily B protein
MSEDNGSCQSETSRKIDFLRINEIIRNGIRIFRMLLSEQKNLFILQATIFLCLAIIPTIINWLRADFINHLALSDVSTAAWMLFATFLLFRFLLSMMTRFQEFLSWHSWINIQKKLELLNLGKHGELDIAALEDPPVNDLMNKCTENLWRVQNFTDRLFFLSQNLVMITIAGIVLATGSFWIFLLVFFATFPQLIIELKYGKAVWGIHTAKAEIRRRYWNMRHHLSEVSLLTELKLFQNVKLFLEQIDGLIDAVNNEEKSKRKRSLIYHCASQILSEVSISTGILWFAYMAANGELAIGTFTFYLAAIGDLRGSLSGFFSMLGRQYQDSLFVGDLFEFLSIQPRLQYQRENHTLEILADKVPTIEFQDVSFRYTENSPWTLSGINLCIPAGQKIAIVGDNGAGKSTLMKLLCRCYDPSSGSILIDGHDLRKIPLENIRSLMGVLFQEYANYDMPVQTGISLGRSNTPYEFGRVVKAAKASEADEFIKRYPKGYEQMLGKQFFNGIDPSVGQCQRLALARVFYRDASILVLDEPTASLDPNAEEEIFQRLSDVGNGKTIILISHRFSTVRRAEQIAVLKGGHIVEKGTHDQLMQISSKYAEMFQKQALGYR